MINTLEDIIGIDLGEIILTWSSFKDKDIIQNVKNFMDELFSKN